MGKEVEASLPLRRRPIRRNPPTPALEELDRPRRERRQCVRAANLGGLTHDPSTEKAISIDQNFAAGTSQSLATKDEGCGRPPAIVVVGSAQNRVGPPRLRRIEPLALPDGLWRVETKGEATAEISVRRIGELPGTLEDRLEGYCVRPVAERAHPVAETLVGTAQMEPAQRGCLLQRHRESEPLPRLVGTLGGQQSRSRASRVQGGEWGPARRAQAKGRDVPGGGRRAGSLEQIGERLLVETESRVEIGGLKRALDRCIESPRAGNDRTGHVPMPVGAVHRPEAKSAPYSSDAKAQSGHSRQGS